MKKELKGIDENTVVHCPTENLTNQVLKIAHEAGYKWNGGESFLEETYFDDHNGDICYHILNGLKSRKSYYENSGCNVITADKFITLNSVTTKETVQYVTREALSEIYPHVCGEWQNTINELAKENLLSNEVEIPYGTIVCAYRNATDKVQFEWLAKYLPKPLILKTVERSIWANIYPNNGLATFDTKEQADKLSGMNRIACVELKGTYQIEE